MKRPLSRSKVERELRRAELRERLYRRRFIIPNVVTLGNMFCGFLTIVYAFSDRFEKAAVAIALAILLDGLDGRVARRLNATSKFGVEFDSFSDLISFGVAPAILIYNWGFLPRADEFGVLVTFVFVVCAASRLARFNISAENLRTFEGMPTPGAAAVVAAVVNFAPRAEPSSALVAVSTVGMLTLAYLMVSHVTFLSVKLLQISRMGATSRVAMGALIALTWYNNRVGFLVLALSYCLSGPFIHFVRLGRSMREAKSPLSGPKMKPVQVVSIEKAAEDRGRR